MADEQDRWLDRATAEILLRGESLEAVDPAVRDRAERLAGTLGALSVPPVPTSGELPLSLFPLLPPLSLLSFRGGSCSRVVSRVSRFSPASRAPSRSWAAVPAPARRLRQ